MRTYLSFLAATLTLVGCDANNDKKATAEEAGRTLDQSVDAAGEKADEVGRDLDRAGDRAAAEARSAKEDVKDASREAASDLKETGRDLSKGVKEGADKVERATDAAGRELKKDN